MNAAADRLDDTFPHGTPAGYDQGCKGNGGCPAGQEHGLSCSLAKRFAAGDYRYQKLARSGASPAEIADDLGLLPIINGTPPRKPEPTTDDGATMTTDTTKDDGRPPVKKNATTAEVRAWAAASGIPCPARGPLPRDVSEAYRAAGGTFLIPKPTPAKGKPQPVAPRVKPGLQDVTLTRPEPVAWGDRAEQVLPPVVTPPMPVTENRAVGTFELQIHAEYDRVVAERNRAEAALEFVLRAWAKERMRVYVYRSAEASRDEAERADGEIIANLDAEILRLTIENGALRTERDTLQAELAEAQRGRSFWRRGAA